jgi:hypothetical protein
MPTIQFVLLGAALVVTDSIFGMEPPVRMSGGAPSIIHLWTDSEIAPVPVAFAKSIRYHPSFILSQQTKG